MKNPTIYKAIHPGRDHILSRLNCQDALVLYHGLVRDEDVTIGIVCDGCSGERQQKKKMASEVGANLGSKFLVRESLRLLELKVPVENLPDILYQSLLSFLRSVLNLYPFVNKLDMVDFIDKHLQFTVVGFIMNKTNTVTFMAGDGMWIVDDEVKLVDSNNLPFYPGYHLVDRKDIENKISVPPQGFDFTVYQTEDIKKLAIGSDGWLKEPEYIPKIWGFKHPDGLQRKLNVWSEEHHFSDDVSVIVMEESDEHPD